MNDDQDKKARERLEKEEYDNIQIRKILNSKDLGTKEKALIQYKQLTKERDNKTMVFFETFTIQQENYMDYKPATYWYRTMSKAHFEYLVNNNKVDVSGENDYGGIAPYFDYCAKPEYFGNDKSGTHIVEFHLYCTGEEFCREVGDAKQAESPKNFTRKDPKPEKGAVSIGLGPKGYYEGTAGKIFNERLAKGAISWKLVKVRVKNPVEYKKFDAKLL